MRVSYSAADLLDALLALRLRCVTAADAAHFLSHPEFDDRGDGSSLLVRLASTGKISPPRRHAIESLRRQWLAEHDGNVESCLEAMGIDDEALHVVAEGAETEVVAWLESQAATHGAEVVPVWPEHPADSTQPENPTVYVGDAHAFHTFSPRSGSPESPARFRKLRLHAKGGLGKVSVAQDEQFRRRVALKEILEKHADSPESRARFIREAEITGALEHPGIVPVYALGQHPDGRPFYAMRLVRGTSMQAAIDRLHRRRKEKVAEFATPDTIPEGGDEPTPAPNSGKPKSDRPNRKAAHERELRRLLRRFLAVCDTMQYAHSRGVIHRDLKPANIMLGRYGETLVVDWGLAKTLDGSELPAEDSSGSSARQVRSNAPAPTLTGRVIGTPGFMSPEQALGDVENLGRASDIFSLGATLYCVLTGRPPVLASTVEEELEQIRERAFPRPRELNRNVAPALEAICLKALAWSTEDRYSSAAVLGEDLERWLADEPVSVWREPLLHRTARWMRRHRSWTVAGAAALVLVTIVSLVATTLVDAARQRASMARRSEEVQRRRAEAQGQEAQRLAASLLMQNVEALRRDRPLGWTWEGLEQLQKAIQFAPDAVDPVQARTLAAACRSSVDARLRGVYARAQISHCLAFSPDSRLLAIAASKSPLTGKAMVALVDLATSDERMLSYRRDLLWELSNGGSTDGGRSIAFSPDGAWLVVGTRSGWLYRWRMQDPEAPPVGWKAQDEQVEVHEVLFSPEGDSLYAVSRNARGAGAGTVCTITRWPTTWPEAPEATREAPGVVHLAWCSDRSLLFASGDNAQWLNAESLEVVDIAPVEVREVAGNPGAGVIAGEDGGELHLIDDRTRKVLLSLRDPDLAEAAHDGAMRALGFGQNGSLLATGANEDGIKIWDVASGTLRVRIPLPGSATTAPQFSPNGHWLASPADGRTVVYEVRRSDLVSPTALQAKPLEQFAYSPDGSKQLLATRAGDAFMEVSLSSPADRNASWTLPVDWSGGFQPNFAWRGDGSVLCIPPGRAAHWLDPGSAGNARPVPEIGAAPRLAAWSRSGALLWMVQGTSEVQVWAVRGNGDSSDEFKLLREYSTKSMAIVTGRQTITALAAAGERALVGLDNGFVVVLDSNSGELRDVWPSHGNSVSSLLVAADHTTAAAGTDRGLITVFDLVTNREIAGLNAFQGGEVASLALDQHGEWLVAASTRGVVRVWRRRDAGYKLFATLREADEERVTVQFHPTRTWFAARVEGDRAIQVWRLDNLNRDVDSLDAGR